MVVTWNSKDLKARTDHYTSTQTQRRRQEVIAVGDLEPLVIGDPAQDDVCANDGRPEDAG